MPRILVIENDRLATAGVVGERLIELGATLSINRAHAGEPVPTDGGAHDGLIVLGGPMNALDDAKTTHLQDAVTAIRNFHHAGKAVLGLCLGGQLVARALGGEVRLDAVTEVGFVQHRLLPEGRADPLLTGLDQQKVMQWHHDTFQPPPGIPLLAASDTHPAQVFRLGRATYALQCHPEVDEGLVQSWMKAVKPQRAGPMPADLARLDRDLPICIGAATRYGRRLAESWLRLTQTA